MISKVCKAVALKSIDTYLLTLQKAKQAKEKALRDVGTSEDEIKLQLQPWDKEHTNAIASRDEIADMPEFEDSEEYTDPYGNKNLTANKNNWKLEDWEKKDPSGLEMMMLSDLNNYNRLFKNQTGRDLSDTELMDLRLSQKDVVNKTDFADRYCGNVQKEKAKLLNDQKYIKGLALNDPKKLENLLREVYPNTSDRDAKDFITSCKSL